jgi:hypothetical protein
MLQLSLDMATAYNGACASLIDKFASLGFATLTDRLATPGAIAALTQEPSSPSLSIKLLRPL